MVEIRSSKPKGKEYRYYRHIVLHHLDAEEQEMLNAQLKFLLDNLKGVGPLGALELLFKVEAWKRANGH